MPIKFKSQEKGEPGVPGGGVKKYYATIVTDGEATIDSLVKEIEKFSALSEPDIFGVVKALENVIQDKLANGKIVRLDKLGSFYPALKSAPSDTPEQVSVANIKGVGINYRPGSRLIAALRNAAFRKA
ncbi:MAG: HU family DNA-binding protein [Bacteroidales bacterium]|nr:HU family DNA-binding protein [Bacteroidales bacterium]